MFQSIAARLPFDKDYPARARELLILTRVLDGTFYDLQPHQFHQERDGTGEYIPIDQRAPSVRHNLCRTVVDDSVSLLFSEGHFPQVDAPSNSELMAAMRALIAETRLNEVMIDAATRGSVGSVAVMMQILKGRVFFSVLDTWCLTPEWDPEAPDTLASVQERYKVKGRALRDRGYPIAEADLAADFWFARQWDADAETWFVPQTAADWRDGKAPTVDPARTVEHRLGFVPIVWIRNLPGASATGSTVDGACTFRAAIETGIEIDYQLSQAGRGLKYSSDPTLVVKEPAAPDGTIARTASNALVVSEDGDAKLLEIGGTASEAVVSYIRALREFALESIHGNRAPAEKLAAATSGRALELMNQGLIWLADRLRISYGEHGLLPLLKMVQRASQQYPISIDGAAPAPLPTDRIGLRWPRWYAPTADDRARDGATLATLVAAGLMSRETAVKALAADYDIENVPAELRGIVAPSGN